MGKKPDLFEDITARTIERIELSLKGELNAPLFEIPWIGGGMPSNILTGVRYRGGNILLLWASAMKNEYRSQKWMTFKQMMQYGSSIDAELSVKGQKGTRILKVITGKSENEDGESKAWMTTRIYTVFNADQIAGLPDDRPDTITDDHRIAGAEQFFDPIPVELKQDPGQAYYSPGSDYVNMPPITDFLSIDGYYATLAHEFGHWTGHKSRLQRDMRGSFGSPDYAFEELVAELTATFTCAHLGIGNELRHVDYLQSWLRKLKDDTDFIRKAATKASDAFTLLDSYHREATDAAA